MGITIVSIINNQTVNVANNTTETTVDSLVQKSQPEAPKSTYLSGVGESVEVEYVDEDIEHGLQEVVSLKIKTELSS